MNMRIAKKVIRKELLTGTPAREQTGYQAAKTLFRLDTHYGIGGKWEPDAIIRKAYRREEKIDADAGTTGR